MDAAVAGPVFSALGVILAAVVVAMFNRRKLGADATEIITRAAAGVVDDLREDREKERLEHAETRREFAKYRLESRRENRVLKDAIRTHLFWDTMILDVLKKQGIHDLPPPPSLFPADEEDDDASV